LIDLSGRVAIVTGAASGIGRSSAEAMARCGASVVVADINGEGAEQAAAEIRAAGMSAMAVRTDVSVESDVEELVRATVDTWGVVDILHNNAAALDPEYILNDGRVEELDVERFLKVLSTNVVSYAVTAKYVVPHMLRAGRGVVVNTGSAGGHAAESSRPMYGSSKAAVIGLTRNLATIYGKSNLRFVSVSPGLIATAAVKRLLTPEMIDHSTRHNLVPRAGAPEDIGNTVAFLVSDEASFITGVDIQVDGGLLTHFPSFAEDLAAV
jgi:NAD(P)-dependent dehydrogenase (short-subunit alcohol dehydrogenase family)